MCAPAVEPVALDQVIGQFVQELPPTAEVPARGSIILPVDGKTLRGPMPLGATHGLHADARGSAPPGLAARNPAVVSRAAQQGAPHLAKLQREFQYRCDRARAALAHHTP